MMNKIQYNKELYSILQSTKDKTFDASYIQLPFSGELEARLKDIGAETEKIQENLRINTKSLKTFVFSNIDCFLSYGRLKSDMDFMILDYESIPISYLDRQTYSDFKISEDYFLFSNTFAFIDFQRFLKDLEQTNDEPFHFVDSYNTDHRKMIFVSLTDKGRLIIKYDQKIPLFDNSIDYLKSLNRFKACFNEESKILPKFLKSAVINSASNFSCENRLKQLFESLDDVVEKARINFEVYLNNLSIDKIKRDYDEVKSKYFNSLSDILAKLSQKIIALPIGVSATLFAIDKVKDIPFFMGFLLCTILITSAYISLLLRVHFKDLLYVSRIFHFDYNSLLDNEFFTKYPEERILFEEIKNRITDRIRFLKTITESYYWIMNIANIFIVSYILKTFDQNNTTITIISMVLLIILMFVSNYILEKDDVENTFPK